MTGHLHKDTSKEFKQLKKTYPRKILNYSWPTENGEVIDRYLGFLTGKNL